MVANWDFNDHYINPGNSVFIKLHKTVMTPDIILHKPIYRRIILVIKSTFSARIRS